MIVARRLGLVLVVAALLLSTLILGNVERASAQGDTALTCEVGALINGQCVETGDDPTQSASCPLTASEDANGCYLAVPKVGGDTCPDDATPAPDASSCRVPVDKLIEVVSSDCPSGFMLGVVPFIDRCTQVTTVVDIDTECEPNLGTAGACYQVQPLTLVCDFGEPGGEFCIVTGNPPVAGADGQPVCSLGFASNGTGDCVRYETAQVADDPCPGGVADGFGFCRVAVPDRVAESECRDLAETLEAASCVVRIAEGSTCPTGFEPGVDQTCTKDTPTVQQPAACPEGSRGLVDGCYIFVAKGPAATPICFDGELIGVDCVIVGDPPPCAVGFGPVGDQCVRFESPLQGTAQCPVGSIEVVSADCLRPVANAAGAVSCEALFVFGQACTLTIPEFPECMAAAVTSPDFVFQAGSCVRTTAASTSDITCPAGFYRNAAAVCARSLAVSGGPTATCDQGAPNLDGLCVLAPRVVPQDPTSECPDGFSPDPLLGGICARFEPATEGGVVCPDGSRGVPGACYILVAKDLAPAPVCFEGDLVGSSCVILGDPPVATAASCPVSADVKLDLDIGLCYELVELPADGVCVAPDLPDPGGTACRREFPLTPGDLQCADLFGLLDGQCVRFEGAVQIPAQCPPDSTEDIEGDCRKPVEDAQAPFTCVDPQAALNGTSCVFTSGFIITPTPPLLVCDEGVRTVVEPDDVICVLGEVVITSAPLCPGIEQADGRCIVTQEIFGTSRQCENAAAFRWTATDCLLVADVFCMDGYSIDDSLGGVCARFEPASGAAGVPFCSDLDAMLNGSACVFTTSFSQQCVPGTNICGGTTEVASCPDTVGVEMDGDSCFETVAFEGATCPDATVMIGDTSTCRQEVPTQLGALECADGFELIDDKCLRLSEPTSTEPAAETSQTSTDAVLVSRLPTTLMHDDCAGGTGTYVVTAADGTTIASGDLVEDPAGLYTAVFQVAGAGTFDVTVAVVCPDGSTNTATEELVFIDPSGVVTDCAGNPVAGATVTLLRSATATGTLAAVADGDATIMDPAINVANPSLTDAQGFYRWDVVAGFYQVSVAIAGQDTVSSAVLQVPPARTDVDLVFADLNCPDPVTPTPTSTAASTRLISPTITNAPTSSTSVISPVAQVAAAPAAQPLAFTGAEARVGLLLGLSLAGVGATVLGAGRRRRDHSGDSINS